MHVKINLVDLELAYAVGVTSDVMDRIDALSKSSVDAVIIDTAHGHSKGVIEVLKKVKEKYTDIDVIVGNIATSESAKILIDAVQMQ